MNNFDYLNKFYDFTKQAQEPMRSMLELNLETLKRLSYVRPEELSNLKKPEELIQRNIEINLENGRVALDYMEKSYRLYEKTLRTYLNTSKKSESKNSGKH